jgi:hypothetical protein
MRAGHKPPWQNALYGSVWVAVEIVDQLQNCSATESFQRLCGSRFVAFLHHVQSIA